MERQNTLATETKAPNKSPANNKQIPNCNSSRRAHQQPPDSLLPRSQLPQVNAGEVWLTTQYLTHLRHCCRDTTMTKTKLERAGFIWATLPANHPSLREVRAETGTWRQELQENMEVMQLPDLLSFLVQLVVSC